MPPTVIRHDRHRPRRADARVSSSRGIDGLRPGPAWRPARGRHWRDRQTRRHRPARRPDPRGRGPVGRQRRRRRDGPGRSRSSRRARASSIRMVTRTVRSSWTAPWRATCTRAIRPSYPGTAATPSRRSPMPAANYIALALRPNELVARWRSFGEYLERVEEQRLGPNLAFLVGHSTVRASVLGADPRVPDRHGTRGDGRRGRGGDGGRCDRLLQRASSTRPGCTPRRTRCRRSSPRRPGTAGCTRPTCATSATTCSRRSTSPSTRSAPPATAPGCRSRTSSAASRSVWGQAGAAIERLEAARPRGLDVAADQYPYTAASTSLATILPPALLGLGVEGCVGALGDPDVRARVQAEMAHGISGWENVAADPGWTGIVIAFAPEPPGLGRPVGRRSRRRAPSRSGRARLRCPRGRPAGRLDRPRLHERRRRRRDHGRAVDRGLHRCRGPPPGPPDPRCRRAAPPRVRQRSARPRPLRARPRDPVPRDAPSRS